MANYWQDFKDAVMETVELGGDFASIDRIEHPVLTEEHGIAIIEAMANVFGRDGLTPASLALQCARVSWEMKPVVEAIVGVPVVLTIGAVSNNGIWQFTCSGSGYENLRETGNYHVWLTLLTGEIIDLTFDGIGFLSKRYGRSPSPANRGLARTVF